MTWAFLVILLFPSGQERRIEHKGYASLTVCEYAMRQEIQHVMHLIWPYRLVGAYTTRCEGEQ